MKIYFKTSTTDYTEVNNSTELIFCQENKKPFQGIHVGINPSVDKNKVYISGNHTIKIIPRADNVCLISND